MVFNAVHHLGTHVLAAATGKPAHEVKTVEEGESHHHVSSRSIFEEIIVSLRFCRTYHFMHK
jgi:5-hydroxyisourate hydrolase-like protein (transthyretin family)